MTVNLQVSLCVFLTLDLYICLVGILGEVWSEPIRSEPARSSSFGLWIENTERVGGVRFQDGGGQSP